MPHGSSRIFIESCSLALGPGVMTLAWSVLASHMAFASPWTHAWMLCFVATACYHSPTAKPRTSGPVRDRMKWAVPNGWFPGYMSEVVGSNLEARMFAATACYHLPMDAHPDQEPRTNQQRTKNQGHVSTQYSNPLQRMDACMHGCTTTL